MKLSKAQQTIIDMMDEGWLLFDRHIKHPECDFTTSVQTVTVKSLLRKNIIEMSAHPLNNVYRLTEQYKNEQK